MLSVHGVHDNYLAVTHNNVRFLLCFFCVVCLLVGKFFFSPLPFFVLFLFAFGSCPIGPSDSHHILYALTVLRSDVILVCVHHLNVARHLSTCSFVVVTIEMQLTNGHASFKFDFWLDYFLYKFPLFVFLSIVLRYEFPFLVRLWTSLTSFV